MRTQDKDKEEEAWKILCGEKQCLKWKDPIADDFNVLHFAAMANADNFINWIFNKGDEVNNKS